MLLQSCAVLLPSLPVLARFGPGTGTSLARPKGPCHALGGPSRTACRAWGAARRASRAGRRASRAQRENAHLPREKPRTPRKEPRTPRAEARKRRRGFSSLFRELTRHRREGPRAPARTHLPCEASSEHREQSSKHRKGSRMPCRSGGRRVRKRPCRARSCVWHGGDPTGRARSLTRRAKSFEGRARNLGDRVRSLGDRVRSLAGLFGG